MGCMLTRANGVHRQSAASSSPVATPPPCARDFNEEAGGLVYIPRGLVGSGRTAVKESTSHS